METLHNGFTLQIPENTFPLSTDSMVLADFVRPGKDQRILDLGSGCATLGLLLCAKCSSCSVTGIELDEIAHEAAQENIRRNGLQARMESICADLRTLSSGSYHICVSNPPYFTGGPVSATLAQARHCQSCSAEELMAAAGRSLRYGGSFYLVQKPENLALIFAAAVKNGLQPKKLRLVYHKPDTAAILTLIQCKKGAKPGLKWDSICLFDSAGNPTADHRRIYHS